MSRSAWCGEHGKNVRLVVNEQNIASHIPFLISHELTELDEVSSILAPVYEWSGINLVVADL
jgi:hypothetical protein